MFMGINLWINWKNNGMLLLFDQCTADSPLVSCRWGEPSRTQIQDGLITEAKPWVILAFR